MLGTSRGIQGKYGDDTSTHLGPDEDAHLYAAREANRGICYGLGFTTKSVLHLPGSQCGSSKGSLSSQLTYRAPPPHYGTAQTIDSKLIRHLDMFECLVQPLSSTLDVGMLSKQNPKTPLLFFDNVKKSRR